MRITVRSFLNNEESGTADEYPSRRAVIDDLRCNATEDYQAEVMQWLDGTPLDETAVVMNGNIRELWSAFPDAE